MGSPPPLPLDECPARPGPPLLSLLPSVQITRCCIRTSVSVGFPLPVRVGWGSIVPLPRAIGRRVDPFPRVVWGRQLFSSPVSIRASSLPVTVCGGGGRRGVALPIMISRTASLPIMVWGGGSSSSSSVAFPIMVGRSGNGSGIASPVGVRWAGNVVALPVAVWRRCLSLPVGQTGVFNVALYGVIDVIQGLMRQVSLVIVCISEKVGW